MGRICLIAFWLTLSALQLSAQSRGYSYLEFVENKGQWDPSIKFKAEMAGGAFVIGRTGFMVVQHDTNDLKRIHLTLHEPGAAGGAGNGSAAGAKVAAGKKTVTAQVPGKSDGDAGAGGGTGGADPYLLHSHAYAVVF